MTPAPPSIGFESLPNPVTDAAEQPLRYCTGLRDLDVATGGGISQGELWLITGAAGQGRSMLLTQLAAHLAGAHYLRTYLASNRDSRGVVASRVYANATSIPLHHIREAALTDHDRERLARATRDLDAAPLLVMCGSYARHRAVEHLTALDLREPVVTVFDDPDWEAEWDLREARLLADRGAIVLVALSHDRLLRGTDAGCDLDPAAGLADVVLDVRHDRIGPSGVLEPSTEPGRALMTVLRNRRGPRYAMSLGFFAHYARYFDADCGEVVQ